MKKIDNLLLCVGAQKAGTSWLHHVLKNSNDIEFTQYKEVHYFDAKHGITNLLPNRLISNMANIANVERKDFVNKVFSNNADALDSIKEILDDSWYCNLFNQKAKYCADFTPEYALLTEDGYKNIKDISLNQKVIFIMRDPVERALSAIQYYYRNLETNIEDEPAQELLRKSGLPLFLDRSKYENTIKILEREFDREDVLFLFYEDVMQDKVAALVTIEKFLGIDLPRVEKHKLNKVVNKSKKFSFSSEVVSNLERSLIETYRFINSYFGELPKAWRELK